MRALGRVLSGAMALLFAFSAVVQWNDPDPARWMLVYGAATVLCALHAAGRPVPRPASLALGATATLWALVLVVTTSDVGPPMDHGPGGVLAFEVVREGLGLALVAGAGAMLAWRGHRVAPD